ncbi:MAG: hypothetical protein JW900_03510 [Anaerolineae bacterium]|nr:hypothetical protein [Anaerolineae bacterium]
MANDPVSHRRPPTWARIVIGLLLAVVSAVLLTLAFPPYGLWPLIWVGFIPLLIAQYRVLPRQVSSLASAVAVGGWLGGYLIPIFGGSGTYMVGLPLVIGVLSFLFDRGARAFHQRTGYCWFVLQGTAAWVGIEMIRSFVPIMGTWAFVANTLYNQAWLIQPVSVFGIFGLGVLVMLVNYTLGLGALWLFDRRWRPDAEISSPDARLVRRWLVGVGGVLVAWVVLSLLLLRPATTPTVRVAALHLDDGGPPLGRAVSQFEAQTRQAAQQGAQLIVWPEGSIDGDPQEERSADFQALAAETGAHLVLGYVVDVEDGLWRNEATVLAPSGEFLGVYGKDHPVVFGGEMNTSLGIYPVYETPFGRLATIICYDLDFTDTARRMARNGAQIIAVPSHDWPAIAAKHYTHLVFRAVENRVAMVKSDGSGNDSVIVDPYGRIVERAVTPGGEEVLLVADVPLGTGDSLAVRLGDWVGWLCLAGLAFFIVLDPVTKRKARRDALSERTAE